MAKAVPESVRFANRYNLQPIQVTCGKNIFLNHEKNKHYFHENDNIVKLLAATCRGLSTDQTTSINFFKWHAMLDQILQSSRSVKFRGRFGATVSIQSRRTIATALSP